MLEEVKGLTKWVSRPVKMTSSYVKENIDISRKRMDVACLDVLQFHWWVYSNPGYLDALKHMANLKEQGKIKTLALTNFDTERLHIVLENGIPIVSNQVSNFFAKLIQRVSPKSFEQALLEVQVSQKFVENFSGDQVLRVFEIVYHTHQKYITCQSIIFQHGVGFVL